MWYFGAESAVPGMAIVEIRPDGTAAMVDATNTLSQGPQLFGSAFKPLIVYSMLKLHPEMNLGEQPFNAVATHYQEQLIENSSKIVDSHGTLDLRRGLATSSNVLMHIQKFLVKIQIYGTNLNYWQKTNLEFIFMNLKMVNM